MLSLMQNYELGGEGVTNTDKRSCYQQENSAFLAMDKTQSQLEFQA